MFSLTVFKKLLTNIALVLVLALANCSGSSSDDEDIDASENTDCLTKNLSVSAGTSTATGDCDTSNDDGDDDSDGDGVLDDADSCDTIYDPTNVCTDTDADGYADDYDNCPTLTNVEQTNTDGDSYGDDCDSNPDVVDTIENDADGDLISDDTDNCPDVSNPSQGTTGDADTIADACDNCAEITNEDQADTDADGEGDECDTDTDGDEILNDADNCPNAPNASQTDGDGDGVGYACDQDDTNAAITDNDNDGDGILNDDDNCIDLGNADQANADGDSEGDECDTDDDNDDILDDVDDCRTDFGEECGLSPDSDGDGIVDDLDLCDDVPDTNNIDTDGDGVGDACDADPDCGEGEGTTYYRDADSDTYGDPEVSQNFCDDADHTGYVEDNTDCYDDGFGAEYTYPGSTSWVGRDCNEDDASYTTDADSDGLADAIDPDASNTNVWYYIQKTVDDGDTKRVTGSDKTFIEASSTVLIAEMDLGWLGFVNATIPVTGVTDKTKACDYRTSCNTGSKSGSGIMSGGTSFGGMGSGGKITSGGFSFGSTGSSTDSSDYGICIVGDTSATCDKEEVVDTDADNDGVEDEDDNCPSNSNADQADEDGDGTGDACDSESYVIDDYTGIWRGYKFNFVEDGGCDGVAHEIGDVGAGFWYSAGTGPTADGDGVEIKSNARLTISGNDDVAYDWANYYTGVKYDSDTMKVYRGNHSVACNSNVDVGGDDADYIPSDCTVHETIDLSDLFGSGWDSDDYIYFVALDGFKIANEGGTIGGEDLIVKTYAYNDTGSTNPKDYDNDAKTGSNGSDHYADKNGKLRVFIYTNYNGPTLNPEYTAAVYYNVIALKTDVWGWKWFDWNSNDADIVTGTSSTQTLTGLDGILSGGHSFVIPYSLGFDGDESGAFELDQFDTRMTLDTNTINATNETANVIIYGNMLGYTGYDACGTPDNQINPNAGKGYLLWCKDAAICETNQEDSGTQREGEKPGSAGDSTDSYTETVPL